MATEKQRMKVLMAGILGLLLFLGVARFAYTPLLPLMREQAGLGVAAGGWLAAANYAGYLVGALLATQISDLHLKDRLYRIGMVVAVASTVMMGLAENEVVWALSRFVAGISTAAGMLLGSGLIMNWLMRNRHRPELGIHFSGIGLSIAGCSLAVLAMQGWGDWRSQWYVFSVLGALLAVPAWRWLPVPDPAPAAAGTAHMQDCPPSTAFLRLLMASYFCAGVGYVVSATFIVAIINGLPAMAGRGAWVFLVIGLAAAPACILWDLVARRIGQVNALILASLLQAFGILLPVLGGGLVGALAGAVLFGGTFAGMVSLVLAMAGRYYPTRPAKMMSKMTVAYGVAQIAAPAITGWLATQHGSYGPGLYLAAGVMVAGAALLGLLKLLERRSPAAVAA
ncbi:MAG TPA: YbfB/YjiJ family MFS transporter [Rhodocyclaceae bacterium]|nr:YbfB/YjiJ family MFS transporter [Rhodocyclaceae bacterium]